MSGSLPAVVRPADPSLIVMLVAAAFFMENLDGTIIATALPQMARSFNVHAVDLSIGITSCLLTLAVLIPISGWAADRCGVRNVFTAALAVFTASSVVCGMTNELVEFTAARIVQGIGGAMMVPVGRLAVLRATRKQNLMHAISFAALSVAAMSLLTPSTPAFWIVAVLFVSGLARSLQFTAINTLSFADVPKPQMSGASTLSSTPGQMTMGMGVAFGAIALRVAACAHGHEARSVTAADFSLAFLFVAALGGAALLDVIKLDRHAGAHVSGHGRSEA